MVPSHCLHKASKLPSRKARRSVWSPTGHSRTSAAATGKTCSYTTDRKGRSHHQHPFRLVFDDAASSLLRRRGSSWRCYATGDEGEREGEEGESAASAGDWRSFRAQLIQSYDKSPQGVENEAPEKEEGGERIGTSASSSSPPLERLWAHDIGNRPEKGCLIVARPDAFLQSQRYFHEAVIFLVDYSPSKGAVGLILNRPTQFTLESISFDITSPTEEGSQDADGNPTAEETRAMREQEELEDQGNSEASVKIPEFLRENRVYFGGDVKSVSSTLMAIHPFNEDIIPGAQKVVDGVYCNGKWFELCGENGPAVALDAPKYKFFAQYAGWAPGQLERELDTNQVWIAAACSPELVLKQVIQLPKPLWREVLELMGGEYAIMSKQQYGEL